MFVSQEVHRVKEIGHILTNNKMEAFFFSEREKGYLIL